MFLWDQDGAIACYFTDLVIFLIFEICFLKAQFQEIFVVEKCLKKVKQIENWALRERPFIS